MKKLLSSLLLLIVLYSCASVPVETIVLSETVGKDIAELERSHVKLVEIHYSDLKDKVNLYIDDVYATFIINFVLSEELEQYQGGSPSIYGSLIAAGKKNADKATTSLAVTEMSDFLEAAREMIESKRSELLNPIELQETEVTQKIKAAYSNTIYANTTITAYLRSVKDVKNAQGQALSIIGLEGTDAKISDNLVRASEEISELIKQAEKVDVKAGSAYDKLEEINVKIKNVTNNQK